MKKITLVLAAALSLLLTSCGKIDSSKWLVNLEDGKKAAQAEDKKILLFFSTDEDGYSKDLKDGLFQTPEFLTALTAEYVLVNLDFSTARFQSVIPSQDMSKSEIKTLQENQKKLDADMKWTTFYDLEMTPAFFVLTKEGYVLSKLDFVDESMDLDSFNGMIGAKAEKIQTVSDLFVKIAGSEGVEKAKATEELFNETDPGYRDLLTPLFRDAVKADEKNESGVIGTFLLSIASRESMEKYLAEDTDNIYVPFEEVSENPILTPSEKQQALYMAGYLLASSGSMDYAKVKDFFQRAIEANPDDEHAAYLKNWVAQIDERIAEMAEAENDAAGQPAEETESKNESEEKDTVPMMEITE